MPTEVYDMGGKSDWSMPDEELHRLRHEQTRALAGHVSRRRLHATTTAAVGPQ